MEERKTSAVPIERTAQAVANSKFFRDIRTTDQALVVLLLAEELDVNRFEALRGMRLIDGQLSMSAGMISSKIKRSGQFDYRIKETSAESCTLSFIDLRCEPHQDIGEATFTMAQAKKAGLTKPLSGWDRYPEDMCFARALTRGARRFCPGLFGGAVYTPEELGAPASSGEASNQENDEREKLKEEAGKAFERTLPPQDVPQLTGAEAGQDGAHGEAPDEVPTAEEEVGQTRESRTEPPKAEPEKPAPTIQEQALWFIGKYRELQYPDKKIAMLAKMQPKPLREAVMAILEPESNRPQDAPVEKPAEVSAGGNKPAAAVPAAAPAAPREHTKELLKICDDYKVDDATKAKWLAFFKSGKLEDLTPEQVARIVRKAHAQYGKKGEAAQ